jgi:NhaP-type Na+/H+ or K+/H+ antiporter
MEAATWALIVGGLLVLMALSGSTLKHLPVSTAMLYLLVGLAIGPLCVGLARIGPITDARLLEHLTEFVVVVSLFSVGLKLSVEAGHRRWLLPLRLAAGSMVRTVGLIMLAGLALGLPLRGAVLLGAILAPTDVWRFSPPVWRCAGSSASRRTPPATRWTRPGPAPAP